MKKYALSLTTLLLLITGCWYLLNSQPLGASAAATDYMPTCSATDMDQWDWPGYMKQPFVNGVKNGGNVSTFNPNSDSYLIMSAGTQFPNNVFYIYTTPTSGAKITVGIETVSSISRLTVRAIKPDGTAGTVNRGNIFSTPKSQKTFKDYYGSLTSRTTDLSPAPPDWFYIVDNGTQSQPVLDTPGTSSLTTECVYAGRNIAYDPSFSSLYNGFSTKVAWTNTTGVTCSGLDVGCWIGKAINGISNTFADLFTNMAQFVANLFIPDGTKIKASFDGFNTFMTSNLGFLVYPFTFLGNVYSAFTGTPTGCTKYACDLSLGTYSGAPVTLDLSAPAKLSHATMDYILLAIQGITVVGLGFAVYHKYLKIVSHGAA